MLTLLPIACWEALFLVFAKRARSRRAAFLAASVIWGILLTVITELLSIFGALTKEGLAFSWGGAAIITCVFFFFVAKKNYPPLKSFSRTDRAFCGGIALFCFVTLFTALLAPPNTWDSMTYHMSRVVHWLQNRSVAHYPTHIIRQLELNPWAEFAIAHLQALSGGDRFANLIQWFSMIGSIIGATLIAGQLGAQRRGQLLAAVLTATIPMGILQASSTQNDFVVTFWLLCFVWSGIGFKEEHQPRWVFLAGASLGLALLTKGTAYLYGLPFVFWFSYGLLKETSRRVILLVLAAALPVLLLNAGHYSRNWALFSNPLLSGESPAYLNETITAKTTLSNFVRNTAIHLSSPFEAANRKVESGIGNLHDLLGMDINDEMTTWPGTTFGIPKLAPHEDFSGNFLHAMLSLITLCLVFFRRSIPHTSSNIMPYVLGVTAGFLLFCLILKWQPWQSRLHLPLLVLGAPAIGVVLERVRLHGLAFAVAALLLIAALPWALWNFSRPLAPFPKAIIDSLGYSYTSPLPQTILMEDRMSQYFTNRPDLLMSYYVAASLINTRGAQNIGLQLGEDNWEYPLWALLQVIDGDGPRMEHIDVQNLSGAIEKGDFQPDLIVKFDEQGIPAVMLPTKYGMEYTQNLNGEILRE
jgi:hypothetical protein